MSITTTAASPRSAPSYRSARDLWGKGIDRFMPQTKKGDNPWRDRPSPLMPFPAYSDARSADVDLDLVRKTTTQTFEFFDPRDLVATQLMLTRDGMLYYLLSEEWENTGRTFADQNLASNQYPLIYVRKDGMQLILTGHHRAAAAAVKGEMLRAVTVKESNAHTSHAEVVPGHPSSGRDRGHLGGRGHLSDPSEQDGSAPGRVVGRGRAGGRSLRAEEGSPGPSGLGQAVSGSSLTASKDTSVPFSEHGDERFKDAGVSVKRTPSGKYYVCTHRARSKYHDKVSDITDGEITRIEATGSLAARSRGIDYESAWSSNQPEFWVLVDAEPMGMRTWENHSIVARDSMDYRAALNPASFVQDLMGKAQSAFREQEDWLKKKGATTYYLVVRGRGKDGMNSGGACWVVGEMDLNGSQFRDSRKTIKGEYDKVAKPTPRMLNAMMYASGEDARKWIGENVAGVVVDESMFDAVPEVVTVYRGISLKPGDDPWRSVNDNGGIGSSWTVSEDTAKAIAERGRAGFSSGAQTRGDTYSVDKDPKRARVPTVLRAEVTLKPPEQGGPAPYRPWTIDYASEAEIDIPRGAEVVLNGYITAEEVDRGPDPSNPEYFKYVTWKWGTRWSKGNVKRIAALSPQGDSMTVVPRGHLWGWVCPNCTDTDPRARGYTDIEYAAEMAQTHAMWCWDLDWEDAPEIKRTAAEEEFKQGIYEMDLSGVSSTACVAFMGEAFGQAWPYAWLTWDKTKHTVEGVWVLDDLQGKGIATHMLAAAEKIAGTKLLDSGEYTPEGFAWARKRGLEPKLKVRTPKHEMARMIAQMNNILVGGGRIKRKVASRTAAAIPALPEWAIEQQFEQYPTSGPEGISYFKGEINEHMWVDCLLYFKGGRLVGVLNRFPKDMGPEKKDNVLIIVRPEARRQGIGSQLWAEAKRRWNVKAQGQDQTPNGKAFTDKVGSKVASLPAGYSLQYRKGGNNTNYSVLAMFEGQVAGAIQWKPEREVRGGQKVPADNEHGYRFELVLVTQPPQIVDLKVYPAHQRKGIATAMYEEAKRHEPNLVHDDIVLPDGEAWMKSLGSAGPPRMWRTASTKIPVEVIYGGRGKQNRGSYTANDVNHARNMAKKIIRESDGSVEAVSVWLKPDLVAIWRKGKGWSEPGEPDPMGLKKMSPDEYAAYWQFVHKSPLPDAIRQRMQKDWDEGGKDKKWAKVAAGIEYRHVAPRDPYAEPGTRPSGHHSIQAFLDGRQIGRLSWYDPGESEYSRLNPETSARNTKIDKVEVSSLHRRRGIASEMLRRAREITPGIRHSDSLSGDGRAWRDAVTPSERGNPARPSMMQNRLGAKDLTHAGIAIQAEDTGRVLMLQRSFDPTDDANVQGTWEFPGGGIDDGESPEEAAWREFHEETGLPRPDCTFVGSWTSKGIYQGHLFRVKKERKAFVEINPDIDASHAVNPDDRKKENPDVTAWMSVQHIKDLGKALRPAVRTGTDWDLFKISGIRTTSAIGPWVKMEDGRPTMEYIPMENDMHCWRCPKCGEEGRPTWDSGNNFESAQAHAEVCQGALRFREVDMIVPDTSWKEYEHQKRERVRHLMDERGYTYSSVSANMVDYKKDRPLTGPDSRKIPDVMPGTSMEPFDRLPFADDLDRAQGTDRHSSDVSTYMTARKAWWRSQPSTRVSMSSPFVVTQEAINMPRIQELVDDPSAAGGEPIWMVKHQGRLYTLNGHHRLVADFLRGETTIAARVVDSGSLSRTSALASTSGLFWRVHPEGRAFGDWDATSKPFFNQPTGTEPQRGYSCFSNPWHLYLYVTVQWSGLYDLTTVLRFPGERVGTGHDGEDLAVPSALPFKTTWAGLQEMLPSLPVPESPIFASWVRQRREMASWATLARHWHWLDMEDPVHDFIIDKFGGRPR